MSKVLTIMGINYSKKTFFSFLFLLFLSLSLVSAFNFPQEDSSLTIFQGNLTNLSQLADVNIPSPSNSEVLTYDTAMGKWISSPVGAVEDTNETTRFNALTNTDCSLGYLAIGVQNNGTVLCALDNTGTTDLTNVLRNNSLNSTQFEIAGTNITIKESWLNNLFSLVSNLANYFTKTEVLNYLTNGTNLNKTYADILYAPISVTGDNSSWNETYANTKYILLSNTTTNLNVVNVTSTGNISISQGNRECYNAGCTVYKYYNGTCLIEVGLTSTQETC